jgi:hypothetical protein
MTMESDIYTALATVGATYPVSLPANPTLPSTSYRFISETQMRSHKGNNLRKRRLQVDCWAKTYTAACVLGDSVKTALDLRVASPFKLITAENAADLSDPEAGIYHRMLEFFVWE